MTDALAELSAAGVAIWLDDLSRNRLDTDDNSASITQLAKNRHVVGITSNPTIFAQALSPDSPGASSYADALDDARKRGLSVEDAVRELTTSDVRTACDKLRGVYDATDRLDGRVSIEVDPRFAHDTSATVKQAAQLWAEVDRPNLFIKIPATQVGLSAITQSLAAGISVNVTLIFSLQRYEAV
ncbi:MAG: transaldolase family protein, partial [Pseudonocardiaceae bacterium]